MNELYQKYIAALRSFVEETAPDEINAEQLSSLVDLSRINSTMGIVAYAYMSNPDRIPPELLPGLREKCMQEIMLYARRAEQMRRLAAVLNQNGIECIYFKGFVVREYYPLPELRTFSDVDFIIRKEYRAKSDELMKTMGYKPCDTWEPAYSYLKGTEYYEIHTDVMEVDVSDRADYIGYFSHIWDHTQPSETVTLPLAREFTPEFHFLYLLTHIAKHISSSGAGIRMYLDLAFFIRHFGDTADWDWIHGELEKLSLSDFANMALSAVAHWFGIASPLPLKPIAPEILDDFTEFTLSGGTYGHFGRDKSIVFLKQQDRNEENVSKTKTLLYHAFPPVDAMKNRFPYLQKHRWLLPVAWVHRFAVTRKEWGRFADHTKNIITADEEEVLKLKRIYKEIGL